MFIRSAQAVGAHQPIRRECALRFELNTPVMVVAEALAMWNTAIAAQFPGTGFVTLAPVIEDAQGECVEAFYLFADDTLWDAMGRNQASLPVTAPEWLHASAV